MLKNNLIDINAICHIVETIKTIKKICVEIIGGGKKTEQVISKLKLAGADVNYHGLVYNESDKSKIISKCHFRLNIYYKSTKIGLTTKSVDYFKYGVPILNTIDGDTKEIIQKHKVGINIPIEDEALIREIKEYICDREGTKIRTKELFNTTFSSENYKQMFSFIDKIV